MPDAVHNKIATPGPGYTATSTSSLTLASSGSISVTTQSGLAYTGGARVRVTYSSDTTQWMEGVVDSYAGTTLVFTAGTHSGSGTYASWNINLAGEPGAATAVTVGTTTTGAAGTSASLNNSGTAYAPVLDFTIPRGDTGATGAQGIGFNARGAWASGTTYAQGDMVSYGGINYYSLQAGNINHQPDVSLTYWQNSATGAALQIPSGTGIPKVTNISTGTTAQALADDLSSPVYAAASGTNTITATLSPAIAAYTTGVKYRIKIAVTNTGAVTVNLNGLGAKTVKKWSGGAQIDVVAGDFPAGQIVELAYDGTYLQIPTPPLNINCRCENSIAQSIPSATFTSITFDTEIFDNGGVHSTVSNTSRFTIPAGQGGTYLFVGVISFASNTAPGTRGAYWLRNGGASFEGLSAVPPVVAGSLPTRVQVMAVLSAAAGDYFELQAYQDSGGAISAQLGNNTYGSIVRLA